MVTHEKNESRSGQRRTKYVMIAIGQKIMTGEKEMWFWLSLIAILFWSGSDLFSKMGSKEEDRFSHWKMIIAVGTVMGMHAVIELCSGAEFGIKDILIYLPVSFLYIFAMLLGYVGLRYVVLSVSTPICNSSGAVAALLCFFI